MDFNQLFFRLSHQARCLMECGYRAGSWGYPYIYISVKIKSENPVLNGELIPELIRVNHYTGIVNSYDLEKLEVSIDTQITIEELLSILEERNTKDINYNNIKRTIYLHNIDLKLRKKILELIPLKLLYSNTTIPEYGYERAKKFIEEMNKEIPDLNLTTEKIDELMNYNYKKINIVESEAVKKETIKTKILSKILSKKI